MAFIVEDGSGIEDATAYVAVATADEYFTDRGNADWIAAGAPEKETAIIKATDYIDKRFGISFKGYRRLKQQGLEWPRLDAYDRDGFAYDGIDNVPRALQKACCEYSVRALLDGPLAPDPAILFPTTDNSTSGGGTTKASGGAVVGEKSVVGPIEEEFKYADPASMMSAPGNITSKGFTQIPGSNLVPYPAADMLIEELLDNTVSRELGRG